MGTSTYCPWSRSYNCESHTFKHSQGQLLQGGLRGLTAKREGFVSAVSFPWFASISRVVSVGFFGGSGSYG